MNRMEKEIDKYKLQKHLARTLVFAQNKKWI